MRGRHSDKSEAELALQRKYELLKKKKAQQALQKAGAAPAAPAPTPEQDKLSSAKQAAIELLRRKRAAEEGGAAAPAAPAPPAAGPASLKLKFVIPKASRAEAPRPVDMRAPAAAARPDAASAPAPAAAQPSAPQRPALLKRPAVRRPAPAPQPQPGEGEAGPSGWQQDEQYPVHQDYEGEEYGEEYEEHDGGHDAKRWHGEEAAAGGGSNPPVGATPHSQLPPTPQLFVSDLPGHFDSDALWEVFAQFSDHAQVVDARVVPGCCYGFVTFGSYEEAQGLLDFQEHQPVEVEDRQLHLSWAKAARGAAAARPGAAAAAAAAAMGGGGVDPHTQHPRVREARAAAAEVAAQIDEHRGARGEAAPPQRGLVSYDDL